MNGILDWVSVGGAFASFVGMLVAFYQARSAKKYRDEAHEAISKIQVSSLAERLKNAQEYVRAISPESLGTQSANRRGSKIEKTVERIRGEFDTALSSLPESSTDHHGREKLSEAQGKLNIYVKSIEGGPDREAWETLQRLLQDTIAELKSYASEARR